MNRVHNPIHSIPDDSLISLPRRKRPVRGDSAQLRVLAPAAAPGSRSEPTPATELESSPATPAPPQPVAPDGRLGGRQLWQRFDSGGSWSRPPSSSGAASVLAQVAHAHELRSGTRAAATSTLVRREPAPDPTADTALRERAERAGVEEGPEAAAREQRRLLVQEREGRAEEGGDQGGQRLQPARAQSERGQQRQRGLQRRGGRLEASGEL